MKRIAVAIQDRLLGKSLIFKTRSSQWPRIRNLFLSKMPICGVCFERDMSKLEVHHIIPFSLDPSLELEMSNMITLCNDKAMNCHLIWGHFNSWKKVNPDIGYIKKHLPSLIALGPFSIP